MTDIDECDFDRFYEVYYPKIVGQLDAITADHTHSRAIAHDAFRTAWLHWDQLRNGDPIAWIGDQVFVKARTYGPNTSKGRRASHKGPSPRCRSAHMLTNTADTHGCSCGRLRAPPWSQSPPQF